MGGGSALSLGRRADDPSQRAAIQLLDRAGRARQPRTPGKTKPLVWWSVIRLVVGIAIVGVIYDLGSRSRTTAPAVTTGSMAPSTAVPMGPVMGPVTPGSRRKDTAHRSGVTYLTVNSPRYPYMVGISMT